MEKTKSCEPIEQSVKSAVDVLLQFDRLSNNPDKEILKQRVKKQLETDGCVTLVMFGCLDWINAKLFTSNPEEFISDITRENDLFMPRVPKINEIVKKLQLNSIAAKVTIILGDTDIDEYFEGILKSAGITLNKQELDMRTNKYRLDFSSRVKRKILSNTEVIYWSKIASLFNDILVDIPESILQDGINSMTRVYTGVNYEKLDLKDDDKAFLNASKKRIGMYARQGEMVNKMLNGIILQTETPWILSSSMLKINSPDLPVIYPWIRSEELGTI